jgi:hypothetical protein
MILAGIGAWAASTSQARLETAPDVRIDPFRIMVNSKDLPVEEFVDLFERLVAIAAVTRIRQRFSASHHEDNTRNFATEKRP